MTKEKDKLKDNPKTEAKPKAESKPKAKPQYLGGKLVTRVSKKTIDGKEFNNINLVDGTGILLSDKDFNAQVTNEQGELVH